MRHLILALAFGSGAALAQTVDIKDVAAPAGDETTTIEIKKGKKDELKKEEALWEVQDGTSDLEGETSATAKDAKAAWKKACEDWKKEFRNDNKDNKILNISCGTPTCGGDAGNKTCSSQATYKIKTKLN